MVPHIDLTTLPFPVRFATLLLVIARKLERLAHRLMVAYYTRFPPPPTVELSEADRDAIVDYVAHYDL